VTKIPLKILDPDHDPGGIEIEIGLLVVRHHTLRKFARMHSQPFQLSTNFVLLSLSRNDKTFYPKISRSRGGIIDPGDPAVHSPGTRGQNLLL